MILQNLRFCNLCVMLAVPAATHGSLAAADHCQERLQRSAGVLNNFSQTSVHRKTSDQITSLGYGKAFIACRNGQGWSGPVGTITAL